MNAEVENKIVETLNGFLAFAKEGAETVGEFTKEQVPLYIQELLTYEFTMSLMWFCIGLFLLFVAFPFGAYRMKYASKKENYVKSDSFDSNRLVINDWIMAPAIILVICSIGMGLPLASSNLDWVKIKIAPRVYIVDTLSKKISNIGR